MANPLRLAPALLPLAVSLLLPSLAFAQSADQGRFGRGLKVGRAYAAADHNPVYIVTPLTVELWARVNGRADASVLLSNEPRHSRTHWELLVEKDTGRFAVGLPGFSPPAVVAADGGDVADDRWHHLAFAFDGTTVRLYVDGKRSAEVPARRVKPYPDTGPLNFGYQVGVGPHPDTTIDEVRISRVARAFATVPDKPYAADADTIGLWHFDEDAAAADKAGFADVSTTRNPARPKDAAAGVADNGGFDNTVGGRTRWQDMDFGPFFSSTITPPGDKANVTHKGISIRLGKDKRQAVTFDTELLRMSAAWEGPFVKLQAGREGLSGHPEMGAKPVFATDAVMGWEIGGIPIPTSDPRPNKIGPLPRERGHYDGLYTYGDRVVLSYTVDGARVLDSFEHQATPISRPRFCRVLEVGPHEQMLRLRIANPPPGASVSRDVDASEGSRARWTDGDSAAIVWATHLPAGATLSGWDAGRLELRLPATNATEMVAVEFWRERPNVAIGQQKSAPPQPSEALKGGPPRYPEPLVTKGTLGKSDGPYAVDTLTAPDENPYKSFLRFGGIDFFSNGDLAACSVSGDVWVVSGIDDKLEQLKWRRFATGLFQPLGLKVVDDKVYVLGRDQITRLHDLNNDGEADFYENFNNDGLVTTNGHAYVTCLEADPAGNFYYLKCGDNTPHGGTVLRVNKDGSKLDVFATGVRNANGLGVGPGGVVSFADNQGEWVPASRLDLVSQGSFLGYQPMSKRSPPPTDPGRPIVWMPQNVDNSSGGQVWVEGDRWGLPAGTMLHTSYGQAALLQVMPESVKLPGDGSGGGGGAVTQAGVWRFPLTFATGIMRGRFRPQDGQLYVAGLRGWQTAGTKDGAIQRVRYTGKPVHAPAELHVHANGVRLRFTSELDRETAADPQSWSVLQWNYRWSSEYGSKHWSAKQPDKQGYDTLEVRKATLQPDGRTVFLEIPGLGPVMQMRVTCNIEAKDGTAIRTDVYNTVHAVGPAFP